MIAAHDVSAHHRGHCHTPACWHRVSEARHRDYWRHRFERLPASWQRWAKCIAHYETFGTPWKRKAAVDTGNGYQGSTQFMVSTWHSAGGSGHPSTHSLYEQLWRTVEWAERAGKSQWSTSRWCG